MIHANKRNKMSTIISFNVNSVLRRYGYIANLLNGYAPDVVLMQELKGVEDSFPSFPKYTSCVYGEKKQNGVGILLRDGIVVNEFKRINLTERNEARCMRVVVGTLSIICVYVPCGAEKKHSSEEQESEHKLRFLNSIQCLVQDDLRAGYDVIIGGDFNVAIKDDDVEYPDRNTGANRILCKEDMRVSMNKFRDIGLYSPELKGEMLYTYESYQDRKRKQYGYRGIYDGRFRIDYLFTNMSGYYQQIIGEKFDAEVPSDHYPVMLRLY